MDLRSLVEHLTASFAPQPPSAVLACETPPPATPAAPAGCPAETLKANLAKCDGGLGIWDKAKKAAGRDPFVKVEGAAGGFGGHADTVNGGVVISPNPDCCGATQTFVFELTNLSNKDRFSENHRRALAGELDKEEYTRAYERVEYDAGKNSAAAFKSCKKKWECSKNSTARHGFIADATDFDDYYRNHLAESHKNYYKDYWDRNIKRIYEAKKNK